MYKCAYIHMYISIYIACWSSPLAFLSTYLKEGDIYVYIYIYTYIYIYVYIQI
jgi:hypothetical protein